MAQHLLPQPLEWTLVVLGVMLAYALGMALYRHGLSRLLLWTLRAAPNRAEIAVNRLKGPYSLMVAALAANLLRLETPPAIDWWLAALTAPAITIFALEALRRVFVDGFMDVLSTSRGGAPIPRILKDIVFGLLYLAAAMLCLGSVFKVDIAPFLTTSAILSVVLGLALQDTLGNLFAGIAMNLDRPFSIGDWVEVDGIRGTVFEISWRATKILTPQQHLIVVPNSQVSKVRVVNYSAPTRAYGEWFEFRASYQVSPAQVREAVEAIAPRVPGILASPAPTVDVLDFTPTAVLYRLVIWIEDGSRAVTLRGKLLEELWYHFKRQGFEMPVPVQEIRLQDSSDQQQRVRSKVADALRQVDFMRDFDEEIIESLAARARHAMYSPDSLIFAQGDPGGSLFLVERGEVLLFLPSPSGPQPLAHLQAGSYFGEMSLLTGEPRTASAKALTDCELLLIDKDVLAPLVEAHPEVLESISRIVAERRAGLHQVKQSMTERTLRVPQPDSPAAAAAETVEAASNELLSKIRAFFKLP